MKEVNKEVIKECATNLLFEMNEEETDLLVKEFDAIKAQMHYLDEIEDLENYHPMTFPFEVINTFLREDEPVTPLEPDVALKNVHSRLGNQVKLPKVVK